MAITCAEDHSSEAEHFVRVTSKASLIHLGSLDSFDITESGIKAASLVFDYLGNRDPKAAKEARDICEQIIPSENFGGEYTALEWLCDYFLASEQDQKVMLPDAVAADWYRYLSDNDFSALKDYLKQKYHLFEWKDKKTPKTAPQYRFLEDFILFNNPRRERWEKSSKILDVLKLKKGEVVADIGSSPGYYTFKFADLVGDTGLVYALDTNERHIEYVSQLAKKLGVKNVQAIQSKPSGFELTRKADLAGERALNPK